MHLYLQAHDYIGQLFDIANGKIMELRAKILDVERERDVLQAKLDAPKAARVGAEDGKVELGPSKNRCNGPLGTTRSALTKVYEAQVPSVLCLHDIAPWAECTRPTPLC